MNDVRCPNCDVTLQAVTARARTGYFLALDQCAQCGGLWCDRWELFPVDSAEVNRLDPVDQHAVLAPVPTVKRELKCPRCRATLQRFYDPVLPPDARIERCAACEGMWLNRGELRRFKGSHAQVAPPRPVPTAEIEQLLGRYASTASWPTVSQLSSAGESVPPQDDDAPSDVKSELMWSALWLGAGALVRLLLHW